MIDIKSYSLTELKKVLSISNRQWDERKEEVLEHIKLYFDYEIALKGRSYIFIIKQQYAEYEPLPRKNKSQEISQFYADETDHILKYKQRNTAANLAREITTYNNKYKHAEGTAENYIRPYLKTNYAVKAKAWCSIDYENFTYNEISSEQLKYLKEQFTKYLNQQSTADIISEQEAGYITKDEAYEKIKGNYDEAIDAFKKKFGFRPYKAAELMKKAWDVQEK